MGGCRILLKWEVLVHHCIHTLGINLHLSLVSLAVEDDDFDRSGRDHVIWTGKIPILGNSHFGSTYRNSVNFSFHFVNNCKRRKLNSVRF